MSTVVISLSDPTIGIDGYTVEFDNPRIVNGEVYYDDSVIKNSKGMVLTGKTIGPYLHTRKQIFNYAIDQLTNQLTSETVNVKKSQPRSIVELDLKNKQYIIYDGDYAYVTEKGDSFTELMAEHGFEADTVKAIIEVGSYDLVATGLTFVGVK